MNVAHFEFTDTFAGEANYCWVKRGSFPVADNVSDTTVMRRAKKILGLNGVRGRTNRLGDSIEFVPYRSCTALFIRFEY